MGDSILEVRDVRKVFTSGKSWVPNWSSSSRDGVVALDRVSFTVDRGAVVSMAGSSGSGKSTLARLLVGLLSPTSGSISLSGEDITQMRPERIKSQIRRKMRLIFQHPDAALNPARTVRHTLGKSLRLGGIDLESGRDELFGVLLDQVALMPRHLDRYPDQLSGGEKRRVAIASALATNPEVIIGDEMFSGLDALTRRQVLDVLLRQREERGLTVIVMTHQTDFVDRFSDVKLRLRAGRITG